MYTSATEMGVAPPPGVGFSCGNLNGPIMAWTVLGSCATLLANEGPVSL